jgi:hypothetical protein
MHATFRQLQLFVALAETGSITAAARACHVMQPTVSMQIKELAESIGLPLYATSLKASRHMGQAPRFVGEVAAKRYRIA